MLTCTGCNSDIDYTAPIIGSAIIVACPICNTKNKIMPKVVDAVVETALDTKPTVLSKIKKFLFE